jgi:hypothetical protein
MPMFPETNPPGYNDAEHRLNPDLVPLSQFWIAHPVRLNQVSPVYTIRVSLGNRLAPPLACLPAQSVQRTKSTSGSLISRIDFQASDMCILSILVVLDNPNLN